MMGNYSRRYQNQKGEGNAKFVVTLAIIALVGYVLYAVLPIYYKEQDLSHQLREVARVGAIQGQDNKKVEAEADKIVKAQGIPTDLKVTVERKGQLVTVKCKGSLKISLLVYDYVYNIDIEQRGDATGY